MELDKGDCPDEYFTSYEDLEIHRIMLSDKRRNLAYKEAIENNKEAFQGKTVLDVGAGTGFLSILCAKAGAIKVFAVEASMGMIPILKESCELNGVTNIVEVVEGAIENVELPVQVDVIISEWMGFHLIHEGMLSSVIHARDKFLKPQGILIPNKSRIKACLCTVPKLFEFWTQVDGVNLSHVGRNYRKKYEKEPAVMSLQSADVKTDTITVIEFDLSSICDTDLQIIDANLLFVPKNDGEAQGLCLSFEVELFDIVLSTAPEFPPTHWKQSIIVFPEPMELTIKEAEAFRFKLLRTTNTRRYAIELAPQNVEEIEHPMGCECSLIKCRIITAYMKEHPTDDEIIDMTGECNGHSSS